ncbi:MAG: nuclear transport factor 2 family protein [Proteobacteria bacterium]|nr:nuclear transport factor 2 family protein [Pseudomonadota bacterium]
MTDHEATIRNAYAAFARGDVPGVLSIMAPDIRWTEAEGFPYAGTYTRPEAIVQNVFMKLGSEWDGFAAVPREYVSSGDTVVALGEYSGTYKASGKGFRAPFAHVWKFGKGGVTSFQQHTDTAIVQRALK